MAKKYNPIKNLGKHAYPAKSSKAPTTLGARNTAHVNVFKSTKPKKGH